MGYWLHHGVLVPEAPGNPRIQVVKVLLARSRLHTMVLSTVKASHNVSRVVRLVIGMEVNGVVFYKFEN